MSLNHRKHSKNMSGDLKKTTTISVIHVAEIDSENSTLSNNTVSSDNDCRPVLPTKDKDDFKEDSTCWTTVLKLAVSAICGIFFGVALEKARIFEPQAIREQMVFEMFIMLKTFLAAVATGQLCFAILSILPPFKGKFEKAVEEYTGCFSEKSLLTSAIGAFVLGVGMALSGSCPAMVLIQIGTWVPNAIFTFLGCLTGALIYGMLAPFIHRLTRPRKKMKNHSVAATFKVRFIAIALPMAVLLGIIVFLLEWFWPWTKDTKHLTDADRADRSNKPPFHYPINIFTVVSWPPYASGIIIGLLQIPTVIFLQDTIGGSSSYVTIVSQWVVTERLQKLFPYLADRRLGVGNWWQVFLVIGAILGGLLSSLASSTLATSQGVQAHTAYFGGFCMLIGARFASGCTSGHGVSGMGLLIWMSFIAVPFMFGGGIATSFAMQATGALDNYITSTGAI